MLPSKTVSKADTTIYIVGSKQDSVLKFQEYKKVIQESLRPAVWEEASRIMYDVDHIREIEWGGDFWTKVSLKALGWSATQRPKEFIIIWRRNLVTGEWEKQK